MGKMAEMSLEVAGVDIAWEAICLCRADGLTGAVVGSANDLPFNEGSFDIVTSIDMLECEGVKPGQVVGECYRVLAPGGIGIIVMAAHQWLLSEHDRAVHSVRRFNTSELNALLHPFPIDLLYTGYLFALLFPFMAIRKKLNPPRNDKPRDLAISDVRIPIPPVNFILDSICRIESSFVPTVQLPLGTSVCTVFRKQ
jgi:ubiquinone/menaquinone biosynthesis C-methylase UbiE